MKTYHSLFSIKIINIYIMQDFTDQLSLKLFLTLKHRSTSGGRREE